MEQIYSLLKLFGERYINCSDDQAMLDAAHNRESLVSAFNAILNVIEMKGVQSQGALLQMQAILTWQSRSHAIWSVIIPA